MNEILTTKVCLVERGLIACPNTPANADATDLDALARTVSYCESPISLTTTKGATFVPLQAHFRNFDPKSTFFIQPSGQTEISKLKGHIVVPIAPRGRYALARVIELNLSNDVISRSTEVKTSPGNLVLPFFLSHNSE